MNDFINCLIFSFLDGSIKKSGFLDNTQNHPRFKDIFADSLHVNFV